MNMAEAEHFRLDALRGQLRVEEPMDRHVSWRAGGRAARAYFPADLNDLGEYLRTLGTGESVLMVGLGSNLLVRDGGFPGTVIFTHGALNHLFLHDTQAGAEIYAEAGVASPKLARFAAVHQFEGAEFLAGVPGTVGGALAMNAGCYGAETWERVARVHTIDRGGQLHIREPREFSIGYRQVVPLQAKGEFFAGAWFRFRHGEGVRARRAIKELLSRRIASQPLAEPNAGSLFRNPSGDFAARLIESCGLKGRRIGAAEVSAKHANFIVNKGGASARDIEELIQLIRETVRQRTGVNLIQEVEIVGEALK